MNCFIHDAALTTKGLSWKLSTVLNAYYNEESNYREMNIQDVCEGKYLQLGALVAELNAYYDEGSNCREMNIQTVCEGKYFAARHTDGFWCRSEKSSFSFIQILRKIFWSYGHQSKTEDGVR